MGKTYKANNEHATYAALRNSERGYARLCSYYRNHNAQTQLMRATVLWAQAQAKAQAYAREHAIYY